MDADTQASLTNIKFNAAPCLLLTSDELREMEENK